MAFHTKHFHKRIVCQHQSFTLKIFQNAHQVFLIQTLDVRVVHQLYMNSTNSNNLQEQMQSNRENHKTTQEICLGSFRIFRPHLSVCFLPIPKMWN
jgi:hypothetical protein